MRSLIPIVFAAAIAGSAAAQPASESPPTRTIQCIEVGGQEIPPVCDVPASRLQTRELMCNCTHGGMQVEVAVCAKGQTPPPEGKALNIVRREAARDGSLIGDTFEGRPICVAPRVGGR